MAVVVSAEQELAHLRMMLEERDRLLSDASSKPQKASTFQKQRGHSATMAIEPQPFAPRLYPNTSPLVSLVQMQDRAIELTGHIYAEAIRLKELCVDAVNTELGKLKKEGEIDLSPAECDRRKKAIHSVFENAMSRERSKAKPHSRHRVL